MAIKNGSQQCAAACEISSRLTKIAPGPPTPDRFALALRLVTTDPVGVRFSRGTRFQRASRRFPVRSKNVSFSHARRNRIGLALSLARRLARLVSSSAAQEAHS